MQTGGYDVVLEVREELLNKFMKIGHCIGAFPVLKGTYTLPIPNVPESLKEFTVIGYEVSLPKPPTIEATADLHLRMNVRGQAKFTVLGGIKFEIEVEFTVGVAPSFDQATRRLKIDLLTASIDDVELNDTYHLPTNVIARLNEILTIAMHEYLTEDLTTLELSPVLFATELPNMPPGEENKLTIGLGNFRVLNPSTLCVAVNLLGYNGGDINSVLDFTDGSHIGIGVNEGAMHKVYDFWWDRTTHPKSITKTGSHDFDMPSIVDWLDELADWVVAACTLGLVSTEIDIKRVWAEFGATIRFSKFDFDLKPGNVVEIAGSVSIDAWMRALVTIQTTTSLFWGIWDVDTETYTGEIFSLSVNNLVINIDSASAKVYLDDKNQLAVDILDLDLSIPLDWEIPEFLLNYFVNWLIDRIVENLPPIVLFPAVIEESLPGTTVKVKAAFTKLFIDEPEALVAANIETSGIGAYAPYIANKSPEHMEVHKKDCEWAHRIAIRNRVYFCDLEEALTAGFDGCRYCIPEHHHR
ncbi:MAG: hypothetical protein NQU41_00360 [Candidatus Methanosuratincola sp.]|nr:hypothetical protein [Candidatus Methanosuratincola sp.]